MIFLLDWDYVGAPHPRRRHGVKLDKDLEDYPRAPTSIANRSTAQPLSSMTLASGVYLINFGSASSSYSLRRGTSTPTELLTLWILKIKQYLGGIL